MKITTPEYTLQSSAENILVLYHPWEVRYANEDCDRLQRFKTDLINSGDSRLKAEQNAKAIMRMTNRQSQFYDPLMVHHMIIHQK